MKTKLIIGLIIIVLIGGFLFFSASLSSNINKGEKAVMVATPPTVWFSETTRLYKNILFRFSLVYPDNLQVRDYDDGTSASTITFEDLERSQGFQIFIVPYTEDQVSPEQFRKDVPSGVMRESVEIIISGQKATMFFSEDVVKNKTREVWFIKDGFLYEITTMANLDSWLAQILSTWRFE